MRDEIEISSNRRRKYWAEDLLTNLFSDISVPGYSPAADVEYVHRRFQCEGMLFLTRILPLLDDAMLQGFRVGKFSCPSNFQKFKGSSRAALPKFLAGLLKNVFEPDTGNLKPLVMESRNLRVSSVRAIRQVTTAFKKLRAPKDIQKEIEHYKEMLALDASLPDSFKAGDLSQEAIEVLNLASHLTAELLEKRFGEGPGLDLFNINPKHGPGAVSTKGVLNASKHTVVKPLYTRNQNLAYPFPEFFHYNQDHLALVESNGQIPFSRISGQRGREGRLGFNTRELSLTRAQSILGFGVEMEGADWSGSVLRRSRPNRPRNGESVKWQRKDYCDWQSNSSIARGSVFGTIAPFDDRINGLSVKYWDYIEWWCDACCTRTIAVPKTYDKLRIISAEPVPAIALQLGQAGAIQQYLERWVRFRHGIRFSDQSVNQLLARDATVTGQRATLDQSSASDRVSCALVEAVLSRVPIIKRQLFSTRTKNTKITWPKGLLGFQTTSYRKLRKFAPMGSGVCFPLESIVFWALACACGIVSNRARVGGKRKKSVELAWIEGEIAVYGDDLIVPLSWVETMLRVFPEFGLKFNENKSFWSGPFRESCGLDAYDGYDVTPIKIRREPPSDKLDGANAAAWNDLAMHLYKAGYNKSAEYVMKVLENNLGESLPYRLEHHSYLGWPTHDPCKVQASCRKELGGAHPFFTDVYPLAEGFGADIFTRTVHYTYYLKDALCVERPSEVVPVSPEEGLWKALTQDRRGSDASFPKEAYGDCVIRRKRITVFQ